MMHSIFVDFVTRLSAASEFPDALAVLFDTLGQLGFPRAMFVIGERAVFNDSPYLDGLRYWSCDESAFERFYMGHQFYLQDPLAKHTLQSAEPVHWTNPAFRAGIRADQRLLLDAGRDFRYFDGYTLPIHYERNRLPGALTLVHGRPDDSAFTAELAETGEALHLMVYYLHALVVARYGAQRVLAAGDAPAAPPMGLTPRERECLKWVAAGLASWEIAQRLHLAERTVNAHVSAAMQRFGVSSRTHAVAKALALGLINP